MVVYDVSSIVSKNRNVSDGKLLPTCDCDLIISADLWYVNNIPSKGSEKGENRFEKCSGIFSGSHGNHDQWSHSQFIFLSFETFHISPAHSICSPGKMISLEINRKV